MAYLRLDKNNDFDEDWIKEMDLVSEGMVDREYCLKLQKEARPTAEYLLEHGVKLNHHDEQDVLLVSGHNVLDGWVVLTTRSGIQDGPAFRVSGGGWECGDYQVDGGYQDL